LGILPFPFNKLASFFKNNMSKKINKTNLTIDYKSNILFGNLIGGSVNLVNTEILDYAPIYFGEEVLIGPNCKLITSWHDETNIDIVHAKPIKFGNNV
jgi:acetyltransferase-like isoleucine patch superfamily enzyme